MSPNQDPRPANPLPSAANEESVARAAFQVEHDSDQLRGRGEQDPRGATCTTCATCRGSGGIHFLTISKGIGTWTPTPCPRCRPDASLLAPDLKLKDEAGRKAARAAQQGGA